jgi:NIMA (never in mitosis gene a)-related kinase
MDSVLGKHGYERLKTIGAGSFGKAVLVRPSDEQTHQKDCVVKMVNTTEASAKEREDTLRESKVLSSLRHPCIVRYRDNFLADGWLCIVMDYCEGGDLAKRIKTARADGVTFPKEQVLMWLTQVLLALKYIHDRHILHRDLKSGNLFLSKRDNLKLGDFGIAKVLDSTMACAHTQIGTPYYMSPEICSGEAYGWSSDIWSLGCILFEMCALRVPFEAGDVRSLVVRITTGRIQDLPTEYAGNLQNLYGKMLDRDPVARPMAEKLLANAAVSEMARRMTRSVGQVDCVDDKSEVSGGGSQQEQPGNEDFSGMYAVDDCVEFYSETHKEWLPAVVLQVDDEGKVIVNLKPKTWIAVKVQSTRVRPRSSLGEQPSVPSSRRPSVIERSEVESEEQEEEEDVQDEIEQEQNGQKAAALRKLPMAQPAVQSTAYPSTCAVDRPPPLVRASTPRRPSTSSASGAPLKKPEKLPARKPPVRDSSAIRSRQQSSQEPPQQRCRRDSLPDGRPISREASQPAIGKDAPPKHRQMSQDRRSSAPKLTPRAAAAPTRAPPTAASSACREAAVGLRRGVGQPPCVFVS